MSGTEQLLGLLIELEDRYHRWWFQANTKKGTRPPEAIQIRSPQRKRRRATSEDLKEMFGSAVHYVPEGG